MSSKASTSRGYKGNGSAIQDPRFANFQTDPRFRFPSKRRNNVQVDKRFSRMLRDDDFVRKAKVDRYGRPLSAQAEKDKLKRKYTFEEEDDIDDDAEVGRELKRVKTTYDPIRDGGYSSSSGDSSEEDEDEEGEEETVERIPAVEHEKEVPTGEISSRIAVVNLDWDNIQAADLMAVFSSFLPSSDQISDISVYQSEFGRERMEREELEGPPKEIFTSKIAEESDTDHEEDNDENIECSILQNDEGQDFDASKLRQYQLDRLKYYYAIITFSSTSAAKSVYDAVDGTEYLSSANFFDLRFVPEGTDFSTDKPRDTCQSIPSGYKPNTFVTDALQHSRVKLTWDAEDPSRKEAQARVFRGSRKEIDENDLKAYLGSDTSSSDSESHEQQPPSTTTDQHKPSKKDRERERTRALLGLSAEPTPSSNRRSKSDVPVGDMQITFTAGLSATDPHQGKGSSSVFVNEPDNETTLDKYVRKERERKQRRKDKHRQQLPSNPDDASQAQEDAEPADAAAPGDKNNKEEEEDLGFDDPFFTNDLGAEQKSTSARRKEEKRKKRAERAREEEASAAQRRELELLMMDDNAGGGGRGRGRRKEGGGGVRHFDMAEIEREEKKKKKKEKRHGRTKKATASGAEQAEGEREREREGNGDAFQINVSDPRFAKLFRDHEFAIDPTNPRFRGTEGMKVLLEEGRKRRGRGRGEDDSVKEGRRRREEGQNGGGGGGGGEELEKLVQRVKGQGRKK
ncbi:MAG: hypothetical protein Q9227_002737 [Pyrenula ochraceoflavens]